MLKPNRFNVKSHSRVVCPAVETFSLPNLLNNYGLNHLMKYTSIHTAQQKMQKSFFIFLGLLIWQIVAVLIVKNKFKLPSFSDVIMALMKVSISGALFTDIAISLIHFAIGIIAAVSIGIPIGIVMGWFKKMNGVMSPFIEILRPIPPLAWIPFAMSWFGLTHQAAGFVIFIGMIFPIIINTYTGFQNIPKVHVEAAMVLGCNKNKSLIYYVALPSAMPSIISGIRIAMGTGWMCLVAAEMFGVSSDGLGYELWQSFHLHRMDYVFMYMLLLGFIGFFIDAFFRRHVNKKFLRWQQGIIL